MERSRHAQNERFDDQKAERLDALSDKRLYDDILAKMLFGGTAKIADGSAAYFGDGNDCQVQHVSGDRSTGVTFKILVGLGFAKLATAIPPTGGVVADNPQFVPVVNDVEDSFTTGNSDPTDPRIIRVFQKPIWVDGNGQTIDLIDPITKVITPTLEDQDHTYSSSFAVAEGTADPAPTPPAPPSGFVVGDMIAEMTMQAGAGAFNPGADLTDKRAIIKIPGAMVDTAEDIITTKGDLVIGDGSGNAIRIPIGGTDDFVPAVDTGTLVYKDPITLPSSYPPGHLHGLVLVRTAIDRIQIQVGSCRDEDDTINMKRTSTLLKLIDTDWAAGDAAGGFPETELSGPVGNDTWYHVFLIEDGAGVIDAGFDTSIIATNLLTESGYTKFRRLGAVLTNGSAEIIDFLQTGDQFYWDVSPALNFDGDASSAVLVTCTVPLGVKVEVHYHLTNFSGSTGGSHTSDPDTFDMPASTSAAPLTQNRSGSASAGGGGRGAVMTNTSSQVRVRATTSNDQAFCTLSWVDFRGRA